MEPRRSSWAVRPLSALVDRGARAWQVQGQRGGRCLQAAGPRLPGRERYETGQRWTCPPPPGLGAARFLLDGREGQRRWWHSAHDTAPGVLLTDYSSPHVTDEEAGNSTSQQVREDETPSGLAHPRAPCGLLLPGVHTRPGRGTRVTATRRRPAPCRRPASFAGSPSICRVPSSTRGHRETGDRWSGCG